MSTEHDENREYDHHEGEAHSHQHDELETGRHANALNTLRKRRRHAIRIAFDELDFTFEGAGLLGLRRRPRALVEQIRLDIGRLHELSDALMDILEEAERLLD